MKSWQLKSAKAQLDQLIQNAIMDGPQQITVSEMSKVVVISKDEYDHLTKPQ
jgi:prevent-host-death family protein